MIGTDIAAGDSYLPDVAVINDTDLQRGASGTTTCHFVVEIVGPSDLEPISDTSLTRLDAKNEGYRTLPSCRAILLIHQDAIDVTIMIRTEQDWSTSRYHSQHDVVEISSFGLSCTIAGIYARTPILRMMADAGEQVIDTSK